MKETVSSAAGKRIRFVDVRVVQRKDGGSTGQVTLSIHGGGTVVGTAAADSDSGANGEIRCAAEATARALESYAENRVSLTVLAVYPVADLDITVVVVSSSGDGDASARRLVGSSLTEGSAPRAAALAVMSATNRFLGNLLGDSVTLRYRGQQLDEEILLRERLIGELTTLHRRTTELHKSEALRVEVEQALESSELRYRELVHTTQGLICTHDQYGSIVALNPAAAEALGYTAEEMIGCLMKEFISAAHRAAFAGYLQRILTNGTDQGLLRVVTRLGEERVWLYRNRLHSGPDGEPSVVGVAHDITDMVNDGTISIGNTGAAKPAS